MVMHRRVISFIGVTLLPLDKNSARVLTVAVLDNPSIRPVINSAVRALHKLLCGTMSLVKLSNSITAGARNNSARSSLRHSSSSAGNVVGVPCLLDVFGCSRKSIWWRRRELNPRPQALYLWFYMRSLVISFSGSSPDGQGG